MPLELHGNVIKYKMNVVTSWKILRWPKFRIVSLKDDLWRWEKPSTINVKSNKSSFCPRCFPHKIQGQNAKPYLKAILCLKPLKQCLLYYSVFYLVRIWILYIKRRIWNYLDSRLESTKNLCSFNSRQLPTLSSEWNTQLSNAFPNRFMS